MIAIRLLAGGGIVREAVFREGSVLIGRGPESDFVVVDPSVSRQHARVSTDESGTVWIEDAGSRNGLLVGAERVEKAEVPVAGPLRCRLGAVEVELAVASTDATLELAASALPARGPARGLTALLPWIGGIGAGATLMLIDPSFWSPWQQDRLTRLSWLTLAVAVTLPIVAFVLIGLLRIVGRRAPVGEALGALALVGWGWVLLALAIDAANYVLSVGAHGLVTMLLGNAAVVVTVASLASLGRSGPRGRFFLAWAAAIAILLAGFTAAGSLAARQAGSPQPDYDVKVPIAGVTGPATDLEGYLAAMRADFTVAEERAAEERRRSEAPRP